MEFIEACRQFISIDSTPDQGSDKIAQLAAELCRSRGLIVEEQEEVAADLKQANVIARPVSGRPMSEFMLQTHLDTPDPGPFGLWEKTGCNPFDAHIIDGNIYGLGTADVKLDFLCKLEAISAYSAQTKWKLPPVLVGTFGEETGMAGTLKLIRKNKVTPKMALIGEPSNLELITSGKGMATVEIRIPFEEDEKKYREEHNLRESTSTQSRVFHGRSAHSSTPHLGESAIKKMFDYLLQMPEDLVVMEIDGGVNFNTVPANAFLELDLVSGHKMPMSSKLARLYRAILNLEELFLQFRDNGFNPPHPTLNIGIIRTHADHVFLSGSCRLPPVVTNETYERWMKGLQEVCQKIHADFKITDYKRPFKTDENSIFVRGCLSELKAMGLSDKIGTQPSTNEASLLSRVGVDCISFGPGVREGNIHTPHEHVSIQDLKRAVEFYKRVIERFCL
ncbi:MAG: hypothetical protein BroJett040_25610 [Oligoflexia bacterium]|nr:MAG: hypothetical protein BroJett040_25610 [Oligoflexia bacterium]